MRAPSTYYWILLAITVCGAAIRAYGAYIWPLWQDETFTWWDSRASLASMLLWQHNIIHAPGSYFLTKLSVIADPNSEFVLRLPSLIVSVLAIPLFASLIENISNRYCAILGAWLICLEPECVFQGQQARMYSLLIVCTLCVWWSCLETMRRPERLQNWLLLTLALVAAFWTHPVSLALWACVALTLGLTIRTWGYAILSAGSVLVLSLPGLLKMTLKYVELADRPDQPGAATGLWENLEVWLTLYSLPGLGFATFILACVGWWQLRRTHWSLSLLLPMSAVLNFVLSVFTRANHHVTDDRYQLIGILAMLVGLAVLPVWFSRSRGQQIAVVLLMLGWFVIQAAVVFNFDVPALHQQGLCAQRLVEQVQPGDRVLCDAGFNGFYLFYKQKVQGQTPSLGNWESIGRTKQAGQTLFLARVPDTAESMREFADTIEKIAKDHDVSLRSSALGKAVRNFSVACIVRVDQKGIWIEACHGENDTFPEVQVGWPAGIGS